MIIESIHVKNYRSILNEIVYCENLTALVGANGSGKSSFLQALDLFYNKSPKIDSEDFYNGDTGSEIVVAITFKNLSMDAKKLFLNYIQDDRLTVERVFVWDDGKPIPKYHGSTLQSPEFRSIRDGINVRDRGKTSKKAYESIRATPKFNSLPKWSNLGSVEENLKKWETNHPDECTRERDNGQFFGFSEVGRGYLGRFTRFLHIPAVRDASEDTIEGRGSVITTLMDLVVRSVLAKKKDLKKLEEETQEKYHELLNSEELKELTVLAEQMTNTLKTFVPDAEVDLQWLPFPGVNISPPQADVKLVEDGYSSAITRTGHGLQRAFILTILQHLALAQTSVVSETEMEEKASNTLPNLVLAIEEPELYQHPSRQRHLARIFLQLASGKTPGVAEKTQIIYATHSPLFVGIDNIEQIRLLRKISNGGDKPKITRAISIDLDEVAETIWNVDGKSGEKYTGSNLLPRLQAIMTPWMNEGFFADVVVLVEGETDRAAILGVAKARDYELEGNGFSVIPCGGKTNIDKPYTIFKKLGIQVYVIWDGDYGKGETDGICEKCDRPLDRKPNPKENRRLLSLVEYTETDWPEYVEDTFACFKCDLETTLKNEIGEELFEECLDECQSNFCIHKRKHAIKNPHVIMATIKKAQKRGHSSSTIENIFEKILSLKSEK